MELQDLWFLLIAVLWAGFFVLEGFDFGVGMVTPFLGRDEQERRLVKETTGPFWDGNEVWLLVAGGATFAAFPNWYATMFSAYYIPLFLVLVALILRATGSEYRERRESLRWRATWDWVIAACCLLVPLLIGVAFGGLIGGIPIDQDMEFTGTFVDLVQPYALMSGVTFAALSLFQGLLFLRIRTTGHVEERASIIARPVGVITVVVLAMLVVWTQVVAEGDSVIPGLGAWLALTFAVAAAALAFEHRHAGWAFISSTATIVFVVLNVFGTLYPETMVSSTSPAFSLSVSDSSSTYTLTLMTIVVVVVLPVVLLYTAWNYWIFRKRVTGPPSSDDAKDPEPITVDPEA